MKILNICTLAFGSIILGVSANPAMGFTLDLFKDTESNSTTINFPPEIPVPYDGQQAELNGNDFNGQPYVPSSDTNTGLSDVIGGKRTISVTENTPISPNNNGGSLINLKVDPVNTEVSFNVSSGSNGTASILWDGITGSNQDLTRDDQNSFLIRILGIDSSATFNFEVTDASNNSGVISNPVNTTGDSYFLYDDVVQNPDNTSNVDFVNAKSVKFYTSNEQDDLDFRFDFVTSANTVPFEFSPSLGIIVSGAFIGINVLKKKLKAA